MMFPHDITIYRHSVVDGTDVISRQVVTGVYLYGSVGVDASGKGAASSDTVTVITSQETTAAYGSTWTVQPKDIIVEGVGPEVTRLKDIDGYTVLRVEKNVCGSVVDNITIVGG